jgi:hypothetical protein
MEVMKFCMCHDACLRSWQISGAVAHYSERGPEDRSGLSRKWPCAAHGLCGGVLLDVRLTEQQQRLVSDFGFELSHHVAPPATPLGDKARERGTRTNCAARNQTLANGYNGSSLCENAFRDVINQIKSHDLRDARRL